MRSSILLLSLITAALGAQAPAQPPSLKVTVDSTRREVVILVGPFDLESHAAMPAMEHGMMGHTAESKLMPALWPVDGYFSGVDVTVIDGSGSPLPRRILHHVNTYNFDRRQLIFDSYETLFAWGQETDRIVLPAAVAVPLPEGSRLGFLLAFHNDTPAEIKDAYVRMAMSYVPKRRVKVAVLPFYVDAHYVYGGHNGFDLPVGRSTHTFDFTLPVSGRVIATGGHLHDYGVSVRLVDVASGKVLVKLNAKRDSAGRVLGMPRFVFGFHEDALPLAADHMYRIIGEYNNISGHEIIDGAMASFEGIFEPSDLAAWPKVDPDNPNTKMEIKWFFPELAPGADEHTHMHMDMPMPPAKDSTNRPPGGAAPPAHPK